MGIKKSKQVNIFKKIKLRNIKGDVFFLVDKYSSALKVYDVFLEPLPNEQVVNFVPGK